MEATPQVYRLLVGPYRLALWAILCRFKTRFVERLVDNVLGAQFSELSKAIVKDLAEAREEFASNRKGPAQVILAEQIDRLIVAGHILPEKLRQLGGATATPISLAEQRMGQVQAYFDRVNDTWAGLTRISDPPRPELYAAISNLIWPYYAIVYRGRPANSEKRYFATWMPPSSLMNEPMISRRGGLSEQVNALGLYPARATENELRGGNKALAYILDCTSEAMLDFEDPDPLLGVIQNLRLFRSDKLFVRRDWMRDAILNAEPGAFTDIFHFINDGFRYFLTGDEIGS